MSPSSLDLRTDRTSNSKTTGLSTLSKNSQVTRNSNRPRKLQKSQCYCPSMFWKSWNLLNYSYVWAWHFESLLPKHTTSGNLRWDQTCALLYAIEGKKQGAVCGLPPYPVDKAMQMLAMRPSPSSSRIYEAQAYFVSSVKPSGTWRDVVPIVPALAAGKRASPAMLTRAGAILHEKNHSHIQ